jgi:hypothetical protein
MIVVTLSLIDPDAGHVRRVGDQVAFDRTTGEVETL